MKVHLLRRGHSDGLVSKIVSGIPKWDFVSSLNTNNKYPQKRQLLCECAFWTVQKASFQVVFGGMEAHRQRQKPKPESSHEHKRGLLAGGFSGSTSVRCCQSTRKRVLEEIKHQPTTGRTGRIYKGRIRVVCQNQGHRRYTAACPL